MPYEATWSFDQQEEDVQNKFCWSSYIFASLQKFWSNVGLFHISFPGMGFIIELIHVMFIYLPYHVFFFLLGHGNYCMEPFWITFCYIRASCFQKCYDNIHNSCISKLPSRYRCNFSLRNFKNLRTLRSCFISISSSPCLISFWLLIEFEITDLLNFFSNTWDSS